MAFLTPGAPGNFGTGGSGGGDASAANQTTGNASLASIDTKTPSLGQQVAAASQPVVLTAAQLTTLTPLTTVTVTQSSSANLLARVQGISAEGASPSQPITAGGVGITDGLSHGFITTANAANYAGTGLLGVGNMAQFDDSSPTAITENGFGNLRISANRNLYGTIRDAAGNERGANVTASNELLVNVNNTVTVGAHAVTNAGTFAVQESGTQIQADDAAFTPGTSKVAMVGYTADESSTDSVDEGDGGAARMTLDRKQITTLYPHTAGGLTTGLFTGSDGSTILVATAQVIKASAGQIYGYYLYNPEAAVTFVHFYNTAQASVAVGTTNPLFTIAVPAGSAANLALPYGILFTNAGFSIAATTTAGGNTAPATGVSAVVWYI